MSRLGLIMPESAVIPVCLARDKKQRCLQMLFPDD